MIMPDMITSKELSYVDLWANRIPMPGIDYSKKVVEQMKSCIDIYNKKYLNKEYSLIFSSGEEINFEILQANLCHMLGIDFNNIRGDYFEDYRKDVLDIYTNSFTSYDLLTSIMEHSDKVVDMDNDQNNKCKVINYYKSQIKCNIFKKLSDFEKFDFAAINYSKDDEKYDYTKQKILFIPSNESLFPYFMMGIKVDPDNLETLSKYFVSTLMAPKKEEIKNFFDNQEVIIPTQILVSDNNNLTKNIATAEEKIKLLTMYKEIINEYRIKNMLNISGDYETMLNVMSSIEKEKIYKMII